jgi:hypothetical protein
MSFLHEVTQKNEELLEAATSYCEKFLLKGTPKQRRDALHGLIAIAIEPRRESLMDMVAKATAVMILRAWITCDGKPENLLEALRIEGDKNNAKIHKVLAGL